MAATSQTTQDVYFAPPETRVPRWVRWFASFTRRQPIAAASLAVLVLICAMAVAAPLLAKQPPDAQNLAERLAGPSWDHPLGGDELGRDVWSRLLYGARISLGAGLGATAIGVAAGVVLGLVSGYAGGFVDMTIQRIMDAIMALPPLILLMVLASTLDQNFRNVIIAISIFIAPGTARVVRGSVLTLKEMTFVEAARAIGASPGRIIFAHILPNTFAPVIVLTSITVGSVIIIEAALGYLGLSVRIPAATWGNMLNTGAAKWEQDPLLALAPGIAIIITVFAINLLGDGLRDVLDPRLRGKT
ncbi:MAG: ABC transporter permease [Chloroflexi bacterium]|nr:ABC transporter permease [Chloroflexota bacterium]